MALLLAAQLKNGGVNTHVFLSSTPQKGVFSMVFNTFLTTLRYLRCFCNAHIKHCGAIYDVLCTSKTWRKHDQSGKTPQFPCFLFRSVPEKQDRTSSHRCNGTRPCQTVVYTCGISSRCHTDVTNIDPTRIPQMHSNSHCSHYFLHCAFSGFFTL